MNKKLLNLIAIFKRKTGGNAYYCFLDGEGNAHTQWNEDFLNWMAELAEQEIDDGK